jgi:hypothetical protein
MVENPGGLFRLEPVQGLDGIGGMLVDQPLRHDGGLTGKDTDFGIHGSFSFSRPKE